jgi:hypothetical protein
MPNEKGMGMSSRNGGHLYMQTNEVKNAIIHYHRSANTMAVLSLEREVPHRRHHVIERTAC